MSNGPSAEERKIAVLVAAMQDMHGEIAAMLEKMLAAARAANAASAGIVEASATTPACSGPSSTSRSRRARRSRRR